MRVLVTRPQRDAERTAGQFAALGHEAVIAPTMRIEARKPTIAGVDFSAVIATSAHAIELLDDCRLEGLRNAALFCVGARTAAAARDRGFQDVRTSALNAQDLLAMLPGLRRGTRVLYLAGHDRKALLETGLTARGFQIEVAEIYRAFAETRLPAAAIEALNAGRLDAVLNYSRRSAVILIGLARDAGVLKNLLALPQICLSGDVASAFEGFDARTLIAPTPESSGMLAALEMI